MEKRLIKAPTVEEITSTYKMPDPPDSVMDPEKEVIFLATAVWDSVKHHAFDSHRYLVAELAEKYGKNLWIAPSRERTPYPESIMYSISTMLHWERSKKRRADWVLWIDDDVTVPPFAFEMLRRTADPQKRPFVAGVGYMRNDPYFPAVWVKAGDGSSQWTQHRFGVHEVHCVGLPVAIIHRSIFDRVPQPWFASGDRFLRSDGTIEPSVARTDSWFCTQLRNAGIPIYVNGDLDVTHFGAGMPVNRKTSVWLQDSKSFEFQNLEDVCRGRKEI